jgi:hypothetical protein
MVTELRGGNSESQIRDQVQLVSKGVETLIKSFTCETLESAPFRASARTSRRRHGTFAPSRNIHVANRDVYRHREPLKPATWALRAAAKSPCGEQGRFSPPRKARARRMECSRRRDGSPHAARDPHGADSLPQGCRAMCDLAYAPQAYVATLYTAFEVDEETTQETTPVFTDAPFCTLILCPSPPPSGHLPSAGREDFGIDLPTITTILRAPCFVLHASCSILRAPFFILRASCSILHAPFFISPKPLISFGQVPQNPHFAGKNRPHGAFRIS